ncbi:hypothetical protein B0T37_21765 [Chromobacterium violaceum]|uniref:hypothetical protein n=1 Tax=Chromobacterium violaceum TaxID=536 RepID=UPI0009D9B224|nr:hypothetical protein [Chromobacterium violaceum]OQS08084.1 hypothetical protein B0T38_21775 [Chromobacterium violaceum]OQS20203.1 hypothetical protein B0T37_21765 [Chromobacterium violaceum]
MEPIDKAGILQRLLGGKPASGSRKSAASRKAPDGGRPPDAAIVARKQIASQLRSIDPAWPDAEQRALEVHVRALLAQELGVGAATDPAFGGLVADVAEAIRQHPQFETLAAYLRQQLQHAHKQSS